MADRYYKALKQVELAQSRVISTYEMGVSQFLSLVKDMEGEKMSVNDYIKVTEMFYARYAKKKNGQPAMALCLILLERLQLAQKRVWMQPMFASIDFSTPLNKELEDFVKRKKQLYARMEEQAAKKWLLISVLVSIFLLALLVWGFHLMFLPSLLLCVLLFGLAWFAGTRYVIPIILQERISRMMHRLEPAHQAFEASLKSEPPNPLLVDLSGIPFIAKMQQPKKSKKKPAGKKTAGAASTAGSAPSASSKKASESSADKDSGTSNPSSLRKPIFQMADPVLRQDENDSGLDVHSMQTSSVTKPQKPDETQHLEQAGQPETA